MSLSLGHTGSGRRRFDARNVFPAGGNFRGFGRAACGNFNRNRAACWRCPCEACSPRRAWTVAWTRGTSILPTATSPSRGLALAHGIAEIAERLTQPAKKVLVLDCDNTLWGGVVGEDGLDGIRLGEDGVGRAHQAFQESVLYWMNQGVLLTLASKNNEADVWEVFDKRPAMRLRRGDLVAWRLNWSEKSRSLEEMAEDFGLGLDSFLFWDDNPLEREKMRRSLPQVCVPEVPPDATLWPEMLLNLPELQRFRVTAEDRRKRSQYAAQGAVPGGEGGDRR